MKNFLLFIHLRMVRVSTVFVFVMFCCVNAHAQCDAHFTFAPSTFQVGGGVVLTSATNGPDAKYTWSYGTTNYAASETNMGTYGQSVAALDPGTYYMCLTVTDTVAGCTDSFCDSVVVTAGLPPNPCDASFGYQDGSVVNGIDFYSSPNSATATYSWDFGDGNTDNTANPSHTYAGTGTYYACLTVNDTANGGCTDTYCDSVYVLPPPPPPTCDAHFAAQNTWASDFMFTPVQLSNGSSFSWDFGDGNTSTGFLPVHTYAANGVYYVCLTVNDTNVSGTCTDTWCDSVHVNSAPPPPTCDAHFTSNSVGFVNNVMFNPVQSPIGTTYVWDFGDGTIDSSNSSLPVHHYATGGPFYACLTVTTASCSDTWCDSVHITGPINSLPGTLPPTCDAHFTTTLLPSATTVGNLTFQPVESPAGTTFVWDFGDGTIDSSNSFIPIHQYATSGFYNVCLTITRSFFGTCSDSWCTTVSARMGYTGSAQSANVVVYPNPMNENATITLQNVSDPVAFRIFDNTGRLVFQRNNLSDGSFMISTADVSAGLYFYDVTDGNQIISRGKLVVQQ